jgi:hypothetical protein
MRISLGLSLPKFNKKTDRKIAMANFETKKGLEQNSSPNYILRLVT